MLNKILYEAYTQFEHLVVHCAGGTCIVKSYPLYGEDSDPRIIFAGSYDECVAYVKDIEIYDLESKF